MKEELPKLVIGLGLIVNHLGEILIDQRKKEKSMGGMWEVPGGKKEEGESIQSTVIREIQEELGIQVEIKEKLIEFDFSYTDKNMRFLVYFCKLIEGKPMPFESLQIKWVHPNDLVNYNFPAANKLIIAELHYYYLSINESE